MLKRLVELRKSKKWSLQYIADRLGIAKSTYAGYESGYREPSLESINKIADLLETSVDYLLGRTDHPTIQPQEEKMKMEQPLELTDKNSVISIPLTIDGKCLSSDELLQFIAFVRAKRELENNRN
ncbi:MAG TPA: helix-turn-helix transcriptional regulator [Bacillota bacterium]|nr:helix-turn-helix transcriptional regulator [Bacillota bacterium]